MCKQLHVFRTPVSQSRQVSEKSRPSSSLAEDECSSGACTLVGLFPLSNASKMLGVSKQYS